MITAGIDYGAKTVKVVVMKDGRVAGKSIKPAGFDAKAAATNAFEDALVAAGIGRDDVEKVCATGSGRGEPLFRDVSVTEVSAAARGAIFLNPDTRTVIDVGAEEGRAIRVDQAGKVVDFAVNEKCAAGAGAFVEAMARALEVGLEDMGKLSLQSTQAVPMNAQCAVFAESELVSLVHAKTPKPDMARAIHDAISDRIVSMVRRVGMEPQVVVIGGVAKNVGFLESLRRDLETDVMVPDEPEFVGALGAALAATEP
jgi:benzoyl-CoA reductase subunit D